MLKKITKKKILLFFIVLLHSISIILSAYYEKSIQLSNYNNYIKLNELNYWLNFFTWWSAYTSLLTIIWAIYKLFTREETRLGQLGDITITIANIISGVVYCGGGFKFSYPKHPQKIIPYPLTRGVKTIHIYIFYHFLWHFLAPALVFFYFRKHSRVDRIRKKRFQLISLINPLIYFAYVICRPLLINTVKNSGSKPYNYPSDYPYFFLFWSVGKFANRQEEKNLPYFWHHWSTELQSLFWTSLIIIFSYIIFSLLYKFLIALKTFSKKNIRQRLSYSF